MSSRRFCYSGASSDVRGSVTAIADKLGVEFALIHRERTRNSSVPAEKMEVLVGDVRDKVRFISAPRAQRGVR